MYTEREINEFRNFLSTNTTYDVNLIFATKSIAQIASMCKNIKETMKKYQKEIIDFLRANKDINCSYTESEVYLITYNELIELRKQLGIKSRRKKVKKVAQADDDVIQLGIDFIQSQKTNQLCLSVIQNSEEKDLQILTPEEIKEMYSGEELTEEDLARRGIISDRVDEKVYREDSQDEERLNMIDDILQSKVTILGQEMTFEFLYTLGESELKSIHKTISLFIEHNKNRRSLKK